MAIRGLALAIAASVLSAQASAQTMDHAHMSGMDHSAMSMPQTSAPKKHQTKKPPAKKSEGTDHSQMPGMDHSGMKGMDHAAHAAAPAPAAPKTPVPALTDADRAAAVPPATGHDMMDRATHGYMLLDRLETWNNAAGRGVAWAGRGWVGGDVNRAWLRTEGARVSKRTESANAELLYGRSVTPWWDVVTGVRHDFKPGNGQTFAAIGVQGLAPQKFEIAATAYLGQRGQAALRFEAEYELLLTNRLILQPMVEVNAYGKNDPRRGVGSGLSTAEAGLRLRYEFTRQFAPYIGVSREQAYGRTADFRREESGRRGDTRFVLGVRTWF